MPTMSAESKVAYVLQTSPRPVTVEEIAEYWEGRYALGTIRKVLADQQRKGNAWRGFGRRYWWGGPSCAWWWNRISAAAEGLGQTFDPGGFPR